MSSGGRYGLMEKICDTIGIDVDAELPDKLIQRSTFRDELLQAQKQRRIDMKIKAEASRKHHRKRGKEQRVDLLQIHVSISCNLFVCYFVLQFSKKKRKRKKKEALAAGDIDTFLKLNM